MCPFIYYGFPFLNSFSLLSYFLGSGARDVGAETHFGVLFRVEVGNREFSLACASRQFKPSLWEPSSFLLNFLGPLGVLPLPRKLFGSPFFFRPAVLFPISALLYGLSLQRGCGAIWV